MTTASPGACTNDFIYDGYDVVANFQPRFNVTEVSNATHVTRDLIINSTPLTDGGIYLCAEQLPAVSNLQTSSAQLIVLGNCIGLRIN